MINRAALFALPFILGLALVPLATADGPCCGSGPDLGFQCCGNGPCNIVCCNCDGGCNAQCQATYQHGDDKNNIPGRRLQSWQERREGLFDLISTAHDDKLERPGHISLDAFHAYARKKAAHGFYYNSVGDLSYTVEDPWHVVAQFEELDADRDGHINLAEFLACSSKKH